MRGGAPGSGLGLAIAKQIIDLMHGSIWFESDPKLRTGTNCVVLLPLQPCQDQRSSICSTDADDEACIAQERSIMIIDDIKMNRSMLKRRITKNSAPSCHVSEALTGTGEEALELCKTQTYDVIIIDQYMESAGGVLVRTDVIASMRRTGISVVGLLKHDDIDPSPF